MRGRPFIKGGRVIVISLLLAAVFTVKSRGAQSLTLTVQSADGQKGVPGAQVIVRSSADAWSTNAVTTDAKGRVVLEVPEMQGGNFFYLVNVSHDAYAPRSVRWSTAQKDVLDKVPGGYTIELEKGQRIGGLIHDEKQVPVPGARIYLFGTYVAQTEREFVGFPSQYAYAGTDHTGHFEISDQNGAWSCTHYPPGLTNLVLKAVRPDGSMARFTAQKPMHPNIHSRIEYVPLEDLLEQTAKLTLPRGHTYSGIVVDSEGKPVSGALIVEGYGHTNAEILSRTTTGADGKFRFENRITRQMILAVFDDRFATKVVAVNVNSNTPETRIQLEPALPIQFQVRGEAGEPITNANINVDRLTWPGQLIEWAGKTDSQGLLKWKNRPLEPFYVYIASEPYPTRKAKLDPSVTEHVFTLRKENKDRITIKGTVLDAATGQPVPRITIKSRGDYPGENTGPITGEGQNGAYHLLVERGAFRPGMAQWVELIFLAEGYDAHFTEKVDFAYGDQEINIKLTKGFTPSGTILQPDGKPAENARVLFGPLGGGFFANKTGEYYKGSTHSSTITDQHGKFSFPSTIVGDWFAITHMTGTRVFPLSQLKASPQIQLSPWAKVEGILMIGEKPGARERVSLQTLHWSPERKSNFSYFTNTDDNGHFTFTHVPEGEARLYRTPGKQRVGPVRVSHLQVIDVVAGETHTIRYGGDGRPVIGQIVPSTFNAQIDWENDNHVLTLKQQKGPADPIAEDYSTFERFKRAREEHYQSELVKERTRAERKYSLVFSTDGSFRIDDVLPGTYELQVRVTEKSKDRSLISMMRATIPEIGSVTREIVIPPGKVGEPFDVGTIEMKLSGPVTTNAPPPDLELLNMDGKPMKLSSFRGKYVLLDFWASWFTPFPEHLNPRKTAFEKYGTDARVALVGVNLDSEQSTAARFIEANNMKWLQTYADANTRPMILNRFGITAIPSAMLIGPDGNIVGKELEGDAIIQALDRALGRQAAR